MSLSDPIADALTRIRSALRARHEVVNVRASKICEGICRVLKEEGAFLGEEHRKSFEIDDAIVNLGRREIGVDGKCCG